MSAGLNEPARVGDSGAADDEGAGAASLQRIARPSANGKRPILAGNMPAEQKAERRWVNWRFKGTGKKRTKMPIQPGGAPASTIDPDTWTTFEAALAAAPKHNGIGFVLGDGWTGIDLDHCYAPDGALSELAGGIVARVNSYTERSPGGDGLHIIIRGDLPGDDIPSNPTGVEMYDGERFFCMTGDHLAGTPLTVEERSAEAAVVYDEIQDLRRPPNPFEGLIVAASELEGRAIEPPDYLIDNFLERYDLMLFTGKQGSMKSLLLAALIARQTAGLPALPRPDGSGGLVTKPASWLWLNTDNSARTHEQRLAAILRTMGRYDVPLFSLTTTDFSISDPAHVRWLAEAAAGCGAEGIVVDTLSGTLLGVKENDASEMSLPAAHLRSLANAGLTVVALHHPPKHDPDGSRGSSVLPAKVDRHYTLSRNGDLLTLKAPKLRGGGLAALTAVAALEVDAAGALVKVAFYDGRGAAQQAQQHDAERAILDALDAGPLNTRQLFKLVKVRQESVRDALSELLVARRVKVTDGPKRAKIYEIA